jgi:hypothetical protein
MQLWQYSLLVTARSLEVTNKQYCQSCISLVHYIIYTYDARKLKHKNHFGTETYHDQQSASQHPYVWCLHNDKNKISVFLKLEGHLNNLLQNSAPTSQKTLHLIYPEMPHNSTVGIYKWLLWEANKYTYIHQGKIHCFFF